MAGVGILSLDVRADASVRSCVDDAINRGGRLDVLINNAGYELAGALEKLSSDEARAQFETNFFGVVSMVNAVLPRFLPAGMFEQGVRRSFSLDKTQ